MVPNQSSTPKHRGVANQERSVWLDSVGLLREGWRVTGEIAWLRESPVQKLALRMC